MPSETDAVIDTAITNANESGSAAQQMPSEPVTPVPAGAPEPNAVQCPDNDLLPELQIKAFGRQQMLAIGLAICFLIGGIWVVSSRSTSAENGSAASSDQFVAANYKDQFLSDGAESVSVLSTARMRDYPSTKGTNVVATHQPEETLKGRWVKGVDPSTRWLRVALDGTKVGYVWEGNLQRAPNPGELSPEPYSATIGRNEAIFTFPIEPSKKYEWCNGGLIYSWSVGASNGGASYDFGYYLYTPMGASSCQNGDIEQLISAGQIDVSRVNGNSLDIVYGVNLTHRISQDEKTLSLVISGASSVDKLFSRRPQTVLFKVVTEGSESKRPITVKY